jgi:hypothetical protein
MSDSLDKIFAITLVVGSVALFGYGLGSTVQYWSDRFYAQAELVRKIHIDCVIQNQELRKLTEEVDALKKVPESEQ